MTLVLQSVLGLIAIPVIAWMLSENRFFFSPAAAVRILFTGLGLQLAIAAVLFLTPQLQVGFEWVSLGVKALQDATLEGVRMVFGYLGGGDAPFEIARPENGFILAFQALPLILVVSVLSRLLFHWGILQRIVQVFSLLLQKTLGVGGAVGTASAANIFVGMVEAPLLIRPYLARLTRSELFAVMTVGMATVAGTVMALYATLLAPGLQGAAGHILVASVISAPAALMIARLMVPPCERPENQTHKEASATATALDDTVSTMDAITKGTTDGLRLLAFVTAMLIVMVALVALANVILAALTSPFAVTLRVEQLLGYAMMPVAWIIGVPWSEAAAAGQLLGVKVVLNEFLAYLQMAKMSAAQLSDRSRLILTYALCGFANFGSLGIMVAGLVSMVPARRDEIVSLAPRTIISGTLATLLTGAVVGVFTPA